MKTDQAGLRRSRAALAAGIVIVFAGLAATVLSLPPVAAGLSREVNEALADSGIPNPVTATLLDFRSYDTLLEIAVLLLAATAVRSIRRGTAIPMRAGDEILASLGHVLVPVMILIAGYLLMAGLDAPGGAFQAGATLAAAGVLLVLSGRRIPLREDGLPLRLGLALCVAAFVTSGIACMLVTDAFLDYPGPYAAVIVPMLELGVSVSVALALVEMFVSVMRRNDEEQR